MKNIILLLGFLLVHSLKSEGQNLIDNFSGEDTIACPLGTSEQVNLSVGWTQINTADYFHACISVPSTSFGYQCPANGNAYFGFFAHVNRSISDAREFLVRKLSSSLIKGQRYYVSFKLSLANNPIPQCACNKLGVFFTNAFYGDTVILPAPFVNNVAHVYTDSIISDTSNWTVIKGSFVADSFFNYIMIGNFFDTTKTALTIIDTALIKNVRECNVYYFIDDICVSADSLTCEIPNGKNFCDSAVNIAELYPEKFAVFPNPTTNKIFIDLREQQKFTYSLFNPLGIRVKFKENNSKAVEIDCDDLPQGIYFITLIFKDTFSLTRRIVLMK